MNNSVHLHLECADGITREIIVQAEWADANSYGIEHCDSFTTWLKPDIQDGYIMFSKNKTYWKYEGNLPANSQQKLADFLISYKSADWG